MTARLSSIIAVEKDTKDKVSQGLSTALTIFGNAGLLSGLSRTYTPKDDEGELLPPESTRVQYMVRSVLKDVRERLVSLFDVVATKDFTNCVARADIIIDGTPLLKEVPATYILFLEKQLAELLSFVKRIPVLDSSSEWEWNQHQSCWSTPPTETIRTKKELRVLELAPATKEHQRATQVYQEDIPMGRWKTIKFSGAVPMDHLAEIIERIEKLQRAVKFAREEANRTDAREQRVGETVLQYIFG